MDRVTAYVGATPSAKDVLRNGQFGMLALGKLFDAVCGTNTIVNAFTCIPTTPGSLNVIVTPGEVWQIENLEATTWSALGSDTSHSIMKQGVMLEPTTLGVTPPATVGYSQVFLVQVQYQDSDTDLAVLNYYNAANPDNPFYGPPVNGTGSGQAQSTTRRGVVAVQLKAGIATATGAQVAPSADAGWTGLFTVTVANGASSISSGNITQLSSAPFLALKLPDVPKWVQGGSYAWVDDAGSANAIVGNLSPVPSQYTKGMRVTIKKIAAANTGAVTINLNGLGAVSLTDTSGNALAAGALASGCVLEARYTGTSFVLLSAGASGGGVSTSGSGFTAQSGEGVAVNVPNANVTISIASPGVVTWNAHGLANGVAVQPQTTGALPTGLAAGVTYYVINAATNTFQLAATPGGSAIVTSGSQSGTHTMYAVGVATVSLNFPGLGHNATIGAADYFTYWNAADGHHRTITLTELLGKITFPPGDAPLYLDPTTGHYKIARATVSTSGVGVGHCATPAEIANRAAAVGSDGPALLRVEDIPTFIPSGIGLGATVTVPGIDNGVGAMTKGSLLGQNVTGDKFRTFITMGTLQFGPCVADGTNYATTAAQTFWYDSRRAAFGSDQTWTITHVRFSQVAQNASADSIQYVEAVFTRTA